MADLVQACSGDHRPDCPILKRAVAARAQAMRSRRSRSVLPPTRSCRLTASRRCKSPPARLLSTHFNRQAPAKRASARVFRAIGKGQHGFKDAKHRAHLDLGSASVPSINPPARPRRVFSSLCRARRWITCARWFSDAPQATAISCFRTIRPGLTAQNIRCASPDWCVWSGAWGSLILQDLTTVLRSFRAPALIQIRCSIAASAEARPFERRTNRRDRYVKAL